jgi:hypothetical protein
MTRTTAVAVAFSFLSMTLIAASAQTTPSHTTTQPAKSLEVKFRGGLMSIRSQNATLGEVLSAVSLKTGAEVDLPPLLAGEHITAQLGPASTKEVLERLLSSSRFDYVLLGSEQTGKVTHILLREPETVTSAETNDADAMTDQQDGHTEPLVDASENPAHPDRDQPQEESQTPKPKKVTRNYKTKSPSNGDNSGELQ